MSDRTKLEELRCVWRDQPQEEASVNLKRIVNRRSEELSSRTRSEILMSVGAALLLVGVLAWRLRIANERLLEFGLAAAIAWAVISLYRFRRLIWRRDALRRDAGAVPCLEYYRIELERRRDHLRNVWLWHGPLFLAIIVLIAVLAGRANTAFQPLRNVLPLLLLLAVWTGFGIWRRRLQARDVQREIDEIALLGSERSNGESYE